MQIIPKKITPRERTIPSNVRVTSFFHIFITFSLFLKLHIVYFSIKKYPVYKRTKKKRTASVAQDRMTRLRNACASGSPRRRQKTEHVIRRASFERDCRQVRMWATYRLRLPRAADHVVSRRSILDPTNPEGQTRDFRNRLRARVRATNESLL